MPPNIINQDMAWVFLIYVLSMHLFLIQVDSVFVNFDSVSVKRRSLQNTHFSLKEDVTEQNSKLTPPNNGSIPFPSTNKSTETNTTSSNEPIISFSRNFSTGALIRGFYVFFGLGAIVVIYIVVRTIRLRRKKKTVRKYGILANREDVEMTPLGTEEEEEESTLFDVAAYNSHS